MSQIQTSWPLRKPQQLVYVELGPHNGGMVLGICEEGFSFRAVAPLKADGPVNFAFDLDGKRRLQGTGEIAWAEEDGKTGGLKFSDVTPQFRESLRFWLTADAEQKYVGREVTPATALPLDTLDKPKASPRASDVVESKRQVPARPAEPKPAPPQSVAAKTVEGKPPEVKVPETKPAETSPAEAEQLAVKPLVARQIESKLVETKPVEIRPVEKAPPAIAARPPEPKPVETKAVEAVSSEPKLSDTKTTEAKPAEPKSSEPRPVEKTAADFLRPRSEPRPFTQPPPDTGPALPKLRIYFPPALPEPAAKEIIPEEEKIPAAAFVPAEDPLEPMAPIFIPPPLEAKITTPELSEPAPPAEIPSRSLRAVEEIAAEESSQAEAENTETPRLNRAAAAVIISLALAIILGALVLSFRRDVGQILIRAGQMLTGEEKSGTENVPPPAAMKPKPETVPPEEAAYGLGVTGAAKPAEKSSSSPSKQPAATSARLAPPTNVLLPPFGSAPSEGGTGQKEFEQARENLKGNHRQRELPQAVELLWTAVRKGYVPAEVTLADLFARGEGVEKSCEQARVLLQAAIQKGSPEGRRRLELLKKQGCS